MIPLLDALRENLDAQLTDHIVMRLDVAKALVDAARALEQIMHAVKTPPFTNMSRADMREIAAATLAWLDEIEKEHTP